MSITAKELARKLNLSQTAVSMALNNKPGVSTETRRLVVDAAEKYGYDFTKLSLKKNKAGSIYAVSYRSHNAIMSYSPIFDAMVEGMESVVQKDKVSPVFRRKRISCGNCSYFFGRSFFCCIYCTS